MKKTYYSKLLMIAIIGLVMPGLLLAQTDKSKRPSPPVTASGKIGDATITSD
jgi:hypothetical protein